MLILLAYEIYYGTEKWQYAKQSLHCLTSEILPEEKEMPRRPNEIAPKWIESKDARKTNCAVQVKHWVA